MKDSNIYNLKGMTSSLNLAFHGLFYENEGRTVIIPYGEDDVTKARDYLV